MADRVFIADYDRTKVVRRVWVPLALAGLMGLAGLFSGMPLISFFGAMFAFIALRHWPLTRNERPALVLSAEGAEIDGLGFVAWRDIASVDAGVVQIKSLRLPALDISFRRSLPEAFTATSATRLRPWELRVFRIRRDDKLRLDLLKMRDTPDEIQDAFRYFLSGKS